jgi:multiple sugar transport system ATP-binding protein
MRLERVWFRTVAAIELERLTKVYPDGTRAVHELDLEIADGEFVVFVGPSGCGKTSALRMVAGLEEITDGVVRVGSEVVNDLPPKARDMAMIFQNYALYPHMNVYDNMGFGLKMRGVEKGEIRRRVEQAARILGLSEVLAKRPRHLSGGQRQRVAMGRAIVREPKAFLMDEPLSNLDAKLRVQMRAEIARIQRDLAVTTIYVTHDQSEAMTLGDRVCVLRGGLLQQVDRPQALYDRPANLFVAGFIGSPAMNLVEAELAELGGGVVARFGPHELPVPDRPELAAYRGRRVALGIRPEDLGGDGPARIEVTVDIKEDMGHEIFLHFAVDAPPVTSDELKEIVGGEALEAAVEQTHHRGSPFIARVERGATAREGEKTQLAVDTSRLHFFELQTGEAIGADVPPRELATAASSRSSP